MAGYIERGVLNPAEFSRGRSAQRGQREKADPKRNDGRNLPKRKNRTQRRGKKKKV